MTDLDARVRAAADRILSVAILGAPHADDFLGEITQLQVDRLAAWPPFHKVIAALAMFENFSYKSFREQAAAGPAAVAALDAVCAPVRESLAGAETRQSLPGGSPPDTTKKADSAPAVENTS